MGMYRWPIKMVVIGDANVGKTCLLVSFGRKTFGEEREKPLEPEFEMFESYTDTMIVDKTKILCAPYEYFGNIKEEYKMMSYRGTECFLLCFSVDNPQSLESIETKWYPELREHCPDTPVILVATKKDLDEHRESRCKSQNESHTESQDETQDKSQKESQTESQDETQDKSQKESQDETEDKRTTFVEKNEGLEVARRIQARRYVEVSAKDFDMVRKIFEEGCRIVIRERKLDARAAFWSRCSIL